MRLKKYFRQQMFNPEISGIFINPFYFARKGLYKAMSQLVSKLQGKVLDVGCGQKPYQHLCNTEKVVEYIGLEIDSIENRNNKQADYFYDGKIFPFKNQEFDSVMTNQVLEHVFNPDEFLAEINRILKPEGLLLLTVPFVWDEHEQPIDYARYSSFGLKHLLQKQGFEIISHIKTSTDVSVIFQLINAYLFKILHTKNPYVNLIITILLMSPFNIMGIILAKILPYNEDLYLDNIVLARKKT